MVRSASPHSSDIDQEILRVLNRHPSIVMAFLFGSLAAGRGRTDSDLDVAFAATTPLTSQGRMDLIGDLAVAVGRPVDLIDLDLTHGPLLQQILTQGRKILCRDRVHYAELIRRMIYEEADFMPYYRRILAARRKAWIGT
ncbi:type VII toxin-antitoxin system MntA family adenylyltransferase antitoxin [Nitrospira moscoviensis]|uniref:Polymerase beta nucleotidyltransferase domain-containing protein n=1 Tax=Nitrospira moscoviensis TaxID=42253 RepID=A0A0K2G971_NITMO|nr:nucleotidyltransferase domain-containing protein [Nitrospira moscoviensis]ALA57485.1 hypothetical protein NITMOv2_1054 [Nitrospira moscoviensis]